MKTLILRIYDYFAIHRGVMTIVLLIATILLAFLVTHVDYKEEITDFLPLDGNRREAMQMYQNLSGANRIIAIVGMKDSAQTDPDKIVEAVDAFADVASRQKLRTTSSVDFEKISVVTDFVYSNIPYFLTDRDYQRIDSLLDTPNYTERQLLADRQQALLPTGGLLSANLSEFSTYSYC
jgi:predicted RND superfamily exporter protein